LGAEQPKTECWKKTLEEAVNCLLVPHGIALSTMINSVFFTKGANILTSLVEETSLEGPRRWSSGFLHCVLQSVSSDNSEKLSAPVFRVAEFGSDTCF
jgi:hypothetical protein